MRLGMLPLFLCLFFSVACNSSAPSDSQAGKVVENSYQDLTQLGARVIDCRKLNAESKLIEGQKIYEYQFLAAAEIPAGVAWKNGGMGGFIEDPGAKAAKLGIQSYFTSLPKGTTAVRRGTITFRYTDGGWVSADLPDTSSDGYCPDLKPKDCYERL